MNSELRQSLADVGADPDLSLEILDALNRGSLISPPVQVQGFPVIDGKTVWDWRSPQDVTISKGQAELTFAKYFAELNLSDYATQNRGNWTFTVNKLEQLGLKLSRRAAFGVLNGGMATSYVDTKKNMALSPGLFRVYQNDWERLSEKYRGRPKGVTPAFIQPDGTPGPSFLELKLRHLLRINRASTLANVPGPGMILFQMTSASTDSDLNEAFASYRSSPLLSSLDRDYPIDLSQTPTRIQSLVGTFTSAHAPLPRRLFYTETANGPRPYALPGGHGQNFRVLSSLYKELHKQGYLFFWIGNVDNLANLPSLRSLALLALTGAPAAFDFAFKTPVDVKGGVLYRETSGRLNCADIGVGLDGDLVRRAEADGHPVLFNCATGLFDLEQLLDNLDTIIQKLPVRVSEQDKDLGRYTQAELNTWEVIGLLDRPLILGVEKTKRFLAAKLLMDSLLTSGLHRDHPWFKTDEGRTWSGLTEDLNQGLQNLLSGPFGMVLERGRWTPRVDTEFSSLYV